MLLQARFRGFAQRSEMQKMRIAAVAFQVSPVFMWLVQLPALLRVCTQAAFRRRKALKEFKEAKRSAILIQSRMRGHLRRDEFLKQKKAILMMQVC